MPLQVLQGQPLFEDGRMDSKTWLGIIKDLRTALMNDPLPVEVLKKLLGEAESRQATC